MAPIRTTPSKANPESWRNPKPPTRYNHKRVVKGLPIGVLFQSNYDGVRDGPGLFHPLTHTIKEEMRPVDPRGPPLTLSDLECVRALGDGTDGQVMLVRARERASSTGKKLFALKAIRKKHLRYQDTGDFEGKNRERSALVRMPWSPFVTGILDTFTDDRNAYMMLEYTPCGSLSTIMARGAGKMSPAHMLFYFANIVCGLEHIHNKCGIVNRDVKPQNILVGADGYLTLCDFGPSLPIPPVDFPAEPNRWIGEGTALYNAPETLRLDGQPPDVRFGPAVDWWAAGIILYEMAAGQTPFALPLLPVGVVRDDDADSKLMFELMMAGPTDWPPNSRLGQKLRSLVKGLLTVNANGRLGLRDVMRHPWLATVDWTKMRRKRYLPPALGVPASDMSLYGKAELNPKHFPGLRFALLYTSFIRQYDRSRSTITSFLRQESVELLNRDHNAVRACVHVDPASDTPSARGCLLAFFLSLLFVLCRVVAISRPVQSLLSRQFDLDLIETGNRLLRAREPHAMRHANNARKLGVRLKAGEFPMFTQFNLCCWLSYACRHR